MSEFLPYLRFFPAETLADERYAGWTMEEGGTWFHLLLHAWKNGSIPSDEASLARLAKMKLVAFRKVWPAISDRFIPHPEEPGRLTSRRLEMEREEAMSKSKAGKRGAASRWAKKPKRTEVAMPDACEPDATASDPHCGTDATAMPASQRNATHLNAPQQAGASRPAMLGVGSPAFGVVTHWRDRVWPTLSKAECPEVTGSQVQSLAGLVARYGEPEVLSALDRAASDDFWKSRLELDAFVAKFPRFLPREGGSVKDIKTGMAPVSTGWTEGERDLSAI